MQKTSPLIRTKLHPPRLRPDVVARPRLQERITQGLQGPFTLVAAPAGFGKTTLAASALSGSPFPVAWLSLDENDNQPGRFLTYLVTALVTAEEGIGVETAGLLNGIQPAQPEVILASLINELDGLRTDIILVLDDYQLITSLAVHELVAFLLERLPVNIHLLIATRSDPPLPLARLRARGQIVELRAADLRFSLDESAQFLNDVMGLSLAPEAIAALEERTEGWIAGLQMAALSIRDRQDLSGFIQKFSGTHRYILDYLLEEVLARQPQEVQRFLLHTAMLERLSAPLCAALLAGQDVPAAPLSAQVTLEHLERENLFLIALDDVRAWFRYHHLFSDLLRARLLQEAPEQVPVLHQKAAAWLEQNGYILEAIQHLCAAHQDEQAANLIERYGPEHLKKSDPSIFQMTEALPAEMILAHPKIGLYLSWLLINRARLDKAVPLLKQLSARLAATPAEPEARWMQTFIVCALAFLARLDGPIDPAPPPEEQALEEIPPEEPILRNAADFLYGMAVARRGHSERAVTFAEKSIQREKTMLSSVQVVPTLVPFLSRMQLMLGRLSATDALCKEYLDPLRSKGIRFIYTAGSLKIDQGEVLYERNHLAEAEKYIQEGLDDNTPWRNIMTDGFGLSALARVMMAKGDYNAAGQAAERLIERMQEHARPREFEEDFVTLEGRVHLASGNLNAAARWAQQIVEGEDFKRRPDLYRLTLAHIRMAQGRYGEVEALLSGASLTATSVSLVSRQIEVNLLLAAALSALQRAPEAMALVDASLALAEPEGYLRVFLNAGAPAHDLLTASIRSGACKHQTFANRVLQAFSALKPAGQIILPQSGLVGALTDRELEVLRLIAGGLSNQEIAARLVVSPGTIKAHTASIYRKLEVANRSQAAARAREIGLLP